MKSRFYALLCFLLLILCSCGEWERSLEDTLKDNSGFIGSEIYKAVIDAPKAVVFHDRDHGTLIFVRNGERVWAPQSAGVKFQPVPEAPVAAETPQQRLSQMKNLAHDFTALMIDEGGQEQELRLVPQPLIRYEPKDKRILDGGLFSFAAGTDPEAMLVLEARTENEHLLFIWIDQPCQLCPIRDPVPHLALQTVQGIRFREQLDHEIGAGPREAAQFTFRQVLQTFFRQIRSVGTKCRAIGQAKTTT